MIAATPDHVLPCTPDTVVWGFLGPGVRPALRIRPGETVRIDTVNPVGVPLPPDEARAFFDGHGIPVEGAVAEMLEIMRTVPKDVGPHILTGPVRVEGALPGDVLGVEILGISPRLPAYGVNFTRPGAGSLPGLPKAPWLKVMRHDLARGTARFSDRIGIPLAPFMGTMGVAPTRKVSSVPPGPFGGNIDLKDLRPGAILYLPVQVEGADFFVGDGHAAQGHGEANLTGLETSMTGVFRFQLHKARAVRWPMAETADHYIAMGLDADLNTAAELAVSQSVAVLEHFGELEAEDAYALASMAVDFEITQLVDGVKGVHGRIPKRLLAGCPRAAAPRWGPLP
ncbi:acetamidase/formamidase family protein [Pigmentiphaga sp. NML080357]|uniref:acetamidase/formamidase family protein n=1 Tax=Pigmentiphaga sp. NML080357 TaxID=2008675 RepID=UPI001303BF1F|nr:acetamidase/formamidase family protein [Pigmentiphaga sp. NML080357]